MYYLIIETMDMRRCIDMSETDCYREGMVFDCSLGMVFEDKTFVRDVGIRCKSNPGPIIPASVYCD
ncbi:MAG: hypothetical protein CSA96_01905 [Bacteroidetes bacterium]|nr:MAG: hypothetical protein CSA96_01905 [Bacteroidota bacterium]